MRDNGFDKMPYSRMTVVHPLGNGMFKNILNHFCTNICQIYII